MVSMALPPDQFARIAGRVNLELLATKLVVVVGVGTVGSQVAKELANCGVGRLLFIDDDRLDEHNLVRHALPRDYLGDNKAEALAVYLGIAVPTLRPTALARKVDEALSDEQVDELLAEADLIVVATDDRESQRRIARRAFALDIPAVLPALYGDNGGEVFVQRSPRNPCFFCWDGFRDRDERVRGVRALNADTLGVIQLAVHLCLGILDRHSEFHRLLATQPGRAGPPQLFIQRRFAALGITDIRRRPNCPSCAVGPAHGVAVEAPAPGVRAAAPARARVPDTPRAAGNRPLLLVLGFVILIIVIISATSGGSNPGAQSVTSTSTTQAPTVHLPLTASTTFRLVPVYAAPSSPVLVKLQDSQSTIFPSPNDAITVTSRREGLTLLVHYRVTFNPQARTDGDYNTNIVKEFCLGVTTTGGYGNSSTYVEGPLTTRVSAAHGFIVEGDAVYAALVPGSYALSYLCADTPLSPSIGTVTTPSIGTAYGGLDSALVIFQEHKARRDTVLEVGIIGGPDSLGVSDIRKRSCVTNNAAYQNSSTPTLSPSHVRIADSHSGAGLYGFGEFYALGTVTLPYSYSKIAGWVFEFDCGLSGPIVTL
jgi:molybdopterin/thiamine biosynthesis adenylyltransferase